MLAERLGAMPRDERDERERLDIAHHRRKAADALFERPRRLVRRLGAVECAHRSRLLAACDGHPVRPSSRDGQPAEDVFVDRREALHGFPAPRSET